MSNFGFHTQILTGSQRRVQRSQGNPAAFTRAQARRMIARTDCLDVLRSFAQHANKDVCRAAVHKLARLESGADLARFNVRAWTEDDAREILSIMHRRNFDVQTAAEKIGCNVRRLKDWQRKLGC